MWEFIGYDASGGLRYRNTSTGDVQTFASPLEAARGGATPPSQAHQDLRIPGGGALGVPATSGRQHQQTSPEELATWANPPQSPATQLTAQHSEATAAESSATDEVVANTSGGYGLRDPRLQVVEETAGVGEEIGPGGEVIGYTHPMQGDPRRAGGRAQPGPVATAEVSERGYVSPEYYNALDHSTEEWARLVRENAHAMGVEGDEIGNMMNEVMPRVEGLHGRYRHEVERYVVESTREMAGLRQAISALESAQVDPGRFYSGASGFAGIAAALNVGLGAMVSVLAPGTPNFAMQIIDNAIERDIRAQEANIANQQQNVQNRFNFVQHQERLWGNRRDALLASRAMYYADAAHRIQALAAQHGGQQAMRAGMVAAEELRTRSIRDRIELLQNRVTTRVNMAGPPQYVSQFAAQAAQGIVETTPRLGESLRAPEDTSEGVARTMLDQGRRFMDSGDFQGAAANFEQAYQLTNEPAMLFNSYLAHRDGGDSRGAAQRLEQYLREAGEIPNRAELEAQLQRMQGELDAPSMRPSEGLPGVDPNRPLDERIAAAEQAALAQPGRPARRRARVGGGGGQGGQRRQQAARGPVSRQTTVEVPAQGDAELRVQFHQMPDGTFYASGRTENGAAIAPNAAAVHQAFGPTARLVRYPGSYRVFVPEGTRPGTPTWRFESPSQDVLDEIVGARAPRDTTQILGNLTITNSASGRAMERSNPELYIQRRDQMIRGLRLNKQLDVIEGQIDDWSLLNNFSAADAQNRIISRLLMAEASVGTQQGSQTQPEAADWRAILPNPADFAQSDAYSRAAVEVLRTFFTGNYIDTNRHLFTIGTVDAEAGGVVDTARRRDREGGSD